MVMLRKGVVAHPGLLERKGLSVDDMWQATEEDRYVDMFAMHGPWAR